jgi:hypothetical protein
MLDEPPTRRPRRTNHAQVPNSPDSDRDAEHRHCQPVHLDPSIVRHPGIVAAVG